MKRQEGANMGMLKRIRKILKGANPFREEKIPYPSKEYSAKWYKNNKGRARNAQLKYKFGITAEDYNLIKKSQGGVCAICEGVSDTRRRGTVDGKNVEMSLAVDHNHKTGKVRGLLCTGCNTSLGKFKDNPALLRKAIQYLEKSEEYNVQTTT
jgi:hypothetical protein